MRKIKHLAITMLMGLTACTLALGLSACETLKKGEREGQESTSESSISESSIPDSSIEPVHTHEFGSWKVTQEATCEEEGLEVRTCKGFGCGEQETRTLSAKGHTEVVDEAVAPTCTTEGKTEGSHCSECDKVFVAQEIIPELGHDAECVTSTSKRATCMTKAYCGVCESEYGEVLGHESRIITVEAQEATCEVAGWEEYEMCKLCAYTTKVEIPALGHDVDCKNENSYRATCTKRAYCGVCESEYGEFSHDVDFTNENSYPATCTKRPYCGICGNEYGLSLGHDEECKDGKSHPATCMTKAYCGVCESEYGRMLDHELVWVSAKPATCLESGWDMYQQCMYEECGISSKVEIPALGHHISIIPAIEATCSEIGYTEGQKCDRCNELLVAPQAVKPIGHDGQRAGQDGLTNFINEHSYAADCTRKAYCGICESEYGDEPVYGIHTYITIPAKSPTHTEEGWEEYQVCRYCHYSTYEQSRLAPVPHEPRYYEEKAPTCTEAGHESGTVCIVCEELVIIPALGHDGYRYGEEPIHPDTVVGDCDTQAYCGICGAYGKEPSGHEPRKEATCTTRAECLHCGEEYGEPNNHHYLEEYYDGNCCIICGKRKER